MGGDIECGGSTLVVWYGMQVFVGGKGGPEMPVHANSGTTLNISNVAPLITTPTVGPGQVLTQSFNCPIASALTTWTCVHNFADLNVEVMAYDLNGKQIFPDTLTITDLNTVTLTWVTAQAGKAIIMHGSSVVLASSQPNAIVSNPTGSQSITGQALTLGASVPFTTQGTGTHSGTQTFSAALLAESGRPWIDVTGAPYNADPTGVADSTTAIQTAHNACAAFALGPCAVYFPYGTYKVTSALTWSPYVPAVSGGRVTLSTAIASGNFISISDQYGKPTPDPNANGSVRSRPFSGTFVIINTNAANTAFAFFLGGATAANYATDMTLDGLSVVGFGGGQAAGSTAGVFKFGYNAFTTHITNFHGLNNGGSYFSILAGATNTGEGLTIDSSSFGSSNQVTYPAYLFSWNTSSAGDFHFHNCSYDYLRGISDPTATAINTSVNMTNSHFEWNETTNPYIQAAGGIAFKIINAKFFTPLAAGFFNPFVGTVAGASTLAVTNARYESGGVIAKLYDNTSGTAGNLLALDPFVNASFAPTAHFTRSGGAGAVVTFNSSPADTPTSYDFSGYGITAVGLPGNLFLGGNSTATNIPQFISNSSTVAGVAGTNYTLFRAGVAAEESHSATGDIGLAGGISALGVSSFPGSTAALTADWTCGTAGTVSSCVAATIIGSGGGVPLTFTLPLVARSYTLECDGVVGQATAATANNWNLLTATNGATNVTANYSMNTAVTAMTGGATTDQASTTTTFSIGPTWTLGGTATKMPFHIWAKIEGASASGTVVSLQLVAPTVADLVTIYRGSACRIF